MTQKRGKGFAGMSRERVAEIAKKGGIAAHAAGTAHEFTREEAQRAGRLGGVAPHVRRGRARQPPPPETSPAVAAEDTAEPSFVDGTGV